MNVKIDLHMHSHLSPDGSLREKDFARAFELGKMDFAAITDHDAVDEALRLRDVFGDKIIVGEEITTQEGEIIGLYLTKLVEKGLSAAATVEAIKAQNGLVYIPHPFEKVRKGLSSTALDSIAKDVDIIEVINGRSFSNKARRMASTWADENNVAKAASSDAHGRIGWKRVYTSIEEAPSRDTLVSLLHRGIPVGSRNGMTAYGYPKLNRFRKKWQSR